MGEGAHLNLEWNLDVSGSNLVGLFVLKGELLQAPAHPPAASNSPAPPPPSSTNLLRLSLVAMLRSGTKRVEVITSLVNQS